MRVGLALFMELINSTRTDLKVLYSQVSHTISWWDGQQTHLVRSELLLRSLGVLGRLGLVTLLGLLSSLLFLLFGLLLTGLLALLELALGDHFAGDLVKMKLGDSIGSGVGAGIGGRVLVIRHD